MYIYEYFVTFFFINRHLLMGTKIFGNINMKKEFSLIIMILIVSPFFIQGDLLAQNLDQVNVLLDSSKYEQAIEKLDELIKADRKNASLHHFKGRIYTFMVSGLEKTDPSAINAKREAEECFKKALKYDKENKEIHLDYGKLKIAQGYYDEAERRFNKVIELDELNSTAYSYLVELYGEDEKKLNKIRNNLIKIDKKHNNIDSKLSLSKLFYSMKEYNKADSTLALALKMENPGFEVYKNLAEFNYAKRDFDKFTEYYYSYISEIENREEFDNLYYDYVDIMSDEERETFKSSGLKKKGEFLLSFLNSRDPNPITTENERLVEHIRRLKYARQYYTAFLKRGYDIRGYWYVKLGPPDNKVSESMGGATNLHNTMTIVQTPPNESWSYFSIDPSLCLDFSTSHNVFREIDYFKGAVGWAMYRDRSYLGSQYTVLGGAGSITEFINMARDISHERIRARVEAEEKIDHYIPEFDFETNLNFIIDLCQFKGKNNNTKVELYYGLYNGQLRPVFDPVSNYYTLNFDVDFIVRDKNLNEVSKEKIPLESKFRSGQSLLESVSIEQKNIYLEIGKFELFLQMLEKNSNAGSILKTEINAKDFNADSLMLSDVQFSGNIRDSRPGDKYVKNGLNIFPYPFSEISKTRPLHIYYEIYNLTKNNRDKTSYEITYDIKILKRNESLLKKIFGGADLKESISFSIKRDGTERDTFETTAFDLSKLKFGEYLLTLTAKDLNSGRSTSISDKFIIIE
ncbi:GWxTD domain-containing protein [candidate division KSB1 bacterium]